MRSLEAKAEHAVATYLKGRVGCSVFAGFEGDSKDIPNVTTAVTEIEQQHPQSGNYFITIEVSIVSYADSETFSDAEGAHQAITGEVAAGLELDDLAAQLTANGNGILVVGIESTTENTSDIDEVNDVPVFMSKYQLRLVAGHQ